MSYLKLHNLHPYHAKFYPGIPGYFLDKYATYDNTVLDPFCGSGTTLLECNLRNIPSIGVDVNLISTKISRAKTNNYEMLQMGNTIRDVLDGDDNTPLDFPDANIWFSPNNYEDLCVIYNAIKNITEEKYRNALEVILSSILNKVCNRRHIWNLGYLSDNILPNIESSFSLRKEFQKKCIWFLSAIKETENLTNRSSIYCANAMDIKLHQPIDIVITSPPYPFAVDFARNNRLSYYVLGEDIEKATLAETGARNKRNKKDCERLFFEEMRSIYINIMSQVKTGGYFCMTISDTKRKNEQIGFVQWIMNLFLSYDWKLIENTIRPLEHQSMGQKRITEEHLLVLQK